MRSKQVTRYYCDYCRKAGMRRDAIETHEKHCCRNPARQCRMCDMIEIEQQPLDVLVNAYDRGGVTELVLVSDGCAACMLAACFFIDKREAAKFAAERESLDPAHLTGPACVEYDYRAQRDIVMLRASRILEQRAGLLPL